MRRKLTRLQRKNEEQLPHRTANRGRRFYILLESNLIWFKDGF